MNVKVTMVGFWAVALEKPGRRLGRGYGRLFFMHTSYE